MINHVHLTFHQNNMKQPVATYCTLYALISLYFVVILMQCRKPDSVLNGFFFRICTMKVDLQNIDVTSILVTNCKKTETIEQLLHHIYSPL